VKLEKKKDLFYKLRIDFENSYKLMCSNRKCNGPVLCGNTLIR